jgi:hypothetical protein
VYVAQQLKHWKDCVKDIRTVILEDTVTFTVFVSLITHCNISDTPTNTAENNFPTVI